MATSRSDIFTPQHRTTRSEIPAPMSKSHSYRHLPQTPGSRPISGGSWSTDHPSRSNTLSTNPSSQLPSTNSKSNSMSIPLKQGQGQGHGRSMSVTGLTGTSPGRSFPPRNPGLNGITLPLNNSVSQLATLSHSNHTLSPYARGHEHIAVRSFPHLGKTPSLGGQSRASSNDGGAQRGNVKARRKRMYRLNTKKPVQEEEQEILSPDLDDTPPSDHMGAEEQFGRMSFNHNPMYGHGYGHGHGHGPGQGQGSVYGYGQRDVQPSLTGIAQRVMRPNMARSPASRTSYGFPDIE